MTPELAAQPVATVSHLEALSLRSPQTPCPTRLGGSD